MGTRLGTVRCLTLIKELSEMLTTLAFVFVLFLFGLLTFSGVVADRLKD